MYSCTKPEFGYLKNWLDITCIFKIIMNNYLLSVYLFQNTIRLAYAF